MGGGISRDLARSRAISAGATSGDGIGLGLWRCFWCEKVIINYGEIDRDFAGRSRSELFSVCMRCGRWNLARSRAISRDLSGGDEWRWDRVRVVEVFLVRKSNYKLWRD